MKKSLLFVFAVFTFIFIGISNVSAATTVVQADFDAAKAGTPTNGVSYTDDTAVSGYKWYSLTTDEEFTLGEDIDLGDAYVLVDNNTVNLNGHSIATSAAEEIVFGGSENLTLAGTGTIDGGIAIDEATLTLNGNITYNKIVMSTDGVVIVNGGTLKNGLLSVRSNITVNGGALISPDNAGALILNEGSATIRGGSFTATGDASAVYISGGANATITGGTFTSSNDNGLEVLEDGTKVTITGGTFTGLNSGLTINDNPIVKLSGGTFKATGTGAGTGAIRVENGTFANLLATGYKYSVASTTTTDVYSAKATQVVRATAATTTSTNTSTLQNPKTGDNILLYISMLGLSIVGLTFAGIYIKKRFN